MFICTVGEDDVLEVTELASGFEHLIRIPIGFDDESNHVFSALVSLSALPGQADLGGYELTATIVETSLEGVNVADRFDGRETAGVIFASSDRARVREAIQAATSHLFDVVKPNSVSIFTFVADLPRKALEKFNQLAAIGMEKGYTVTREKPLHGYHCWRMTRAADGTTDAD